MFYEFWVFTLESGFSWPMFGFTIASIGLCVLLTHIYRLIVRRWNWGDLPLYKLIPRVFLSGILLGLIMTVVNF
jgi:hypothetical protein